MEWVVLLIAAGVIAIVVGVCGILSRARWGWFLTVVGAILGLAGLAFLTIQFRGKKAEADQGRTTLSPPLPPTGKAPRPKLVDLRKN